VISSTLMGFICQSGEPAQDETATGLAHVNC
jgi:hypothetical protein